MTTLEHIFVNISRYSEVIDVDYVGLRFQVTITKKDLMWQGMGDTLEEAANNAWNTMYYSLIRATSAANQDHFVFVS